MLASWRDTLAAAFFDDPVSQWMFPDPQTRAQRSGLLWEALLRGARRQGHVHVLPHAVAVAIWEHPAPEDDAGALARALGDRVDEIGEGLALLGRASPDRPHRYLQALGVRPDRQGRGLGAALVAPRLRALDAVGTPVHLLSSNPRNLSFYRRLGFVDLEKVQLPDGPALTSMWRDPGTPGLP